jgi:hypothetical protein
MPTDFVSKLYRMLQDVEVNKDLSAEFKRSAANSETSPIAGKLQPQLAKKSLIFRLH